MELWAYFEERRPIKKKNSNTNDKMSKIAIWDQFLIQKLSLGPQCHVPVSKSVE